MKMCHIISWNARRQGRRSETANPYGACPREETKKATQPRGTRGDAAMIPPGTAEVTHTVDTTTPPSIPPLVADEETGAGVHHPATN